MPEEELTIPTQPRVLPVSERTGEEMREFRYYPGLDGGIVLEAACAVGDSLEEGQRGRLACGYGTSMYDWHREVPIEGSGIPLSAALVVELDGAGNEIKTPYLEWCRNLGLIVRCGRCGLDIVRTELAECPERAKRRREQAVARAAEEKLQALRLEHAAKPDVGTPPVEAMPRPAARELAVGIQDRSDAEARARGYSYDYSGVHIVDADGGLFDVCACGLKDVPGAGADSASLAEERDFPIPTLG